jgi:Kef-type K+ transport system membrane component KefB
MLVFAFRLARIGTLLAFLLAGIISGPHILGLFQLTDVWNFLGEIGIVFLWFTLGLEINIKRLWVMRRNVFGLGAAQVLMVAVMLFPILFGITSWSIMGTIMVALVLAMSSTSTDLTLLADRNELQSNFGRQTFSILLFQDLLAIPLLAMLPVFAGKTMNLGGSIVDVLVMSIGLIVGVVVIGRFILNPLMRVIAKLKSKEVFLLAVMLTIIIGATAMQFIGLPMGLGAFLVGMILSETILRHQIKAEISPYAMMFMAFFFIALGMGLDLNILSANWPLIVGGLVALIFIKFTAIYIVARVRHLPGRDAFLMALILAQGGEFGLLILQTVKTGGIEVISKTHGEILISVIALSIMTTPILLGIYDRLRRSGKLSASAKKLKVADKIAPPQIIICGFGRVGQIIAKLLESQNISYAAIDMDVDAVMQGRENGHNVFYGDASNSDVLRDLGLTPRKTRGVVVALDNAWRSKSAVRAVRTVMPRVKIFARARNLDEMNALRAEGVNEALPETVESSFRLGFSILEQVGVKPNKIRELLIDFRDDNYKKLSQ